MPPAFQNISPLENPTIPLAGTGHLDHVAQAAGAGLDGLRAAIEDHVPVLQVQTELALGVPV